MTIPHYLVLEGVSSIIPLQQALGDLICIAFYYLLRVGEYTYKPPKQRTHTQRFRIKDVIFRWSDHTIIANTAPLADLLLATHATLCISNQKNGKRGQCISHHCTQTAYSPIKALARRVAHIMTNTTNHNTAISTYFITPGVPKQVTAMHINNTLKQAVHHLGLSKFGFTRDNVSSHSLRAGGAMAMKLNGVDSITIKNRDAGPQTPFLTTSKNKLERSQQVLQLKCPSTSHSPTTLTFSVNHTYMKQKITPIH